jgi:hypothetical protein
LAEKKIQVAVEEDARKQAYPDEAVWKLLAGAEKVFVAVGKKVVELDPSATDRDILLKKVIGPSGNLRAPTLRIGKVFYIGYHPEMYNTLKR